MPVRHPLGALDGGLTGCCSGNSSILGGHFSKADSYHLTRKIVASVEYVVSLVDNLPLYEQEVELRIGWFF